MIDKENTGLLMIKDMLSVFRGIENGRSKSTLNKENSRSCSFMVYVFDRMERKGYVKSMKKKKNSRKYDLEITEKGKELYKLIA